jgi:hypothetical protein
MHTTNLRAVQVTEPRPCEHLTFVTCRTCGKTYQQRLDEAQQVTR